MRENMNNGLYVELKVGELMEQPTYSGLLKLADHVEESEVYWGILEYLTEKGWIEDDEAQEESI